MPEDDQAVPDVTQRIAHFALDLDNAAEQLLPATTASQLCEAQRDAAQAAIADLKELAGKARGLLQSRTLVAEARQIMVPATDYALYGVQHALDDLNAIDLSDVAETSTMDAIKALIAQAKRISNEIASSVHRHADGTGDCTDNGVATVVQADGPAGNAAAAKPADPLEPDQ